MTEYRALGHRGNPKGCAIYYGYAIVTITGVGTTGTTAVTFSPTWNAIPYIVCGIPMWTLSAGGASAYANYHITTYSTTGMTIYAVANAAPGLYLTLSLEFDYIIVGIPDD
jgi:hypothetical protein